MFNEEKAVEGNEGDGEGGEEDAGGLGRRHQLANVLLQIGMVMKMTKR